jgi:hypothetical protein
MEAASKGRDTNEDFIPSRARCIAIIGANWGCLLHVIDRHTPVDCQTWMHGYLSGVFHDFFSPGSASRRTFVSGIPNVWDLKKYHNMEMVYDLSDPVIDESSFELRDWTCSEFGHWQGKEEMPPNMPEPWGLGFTMRAKIDANHAADTVTRRSRMGFLVYLNCVPIYRSSKK